MNRHFFNSFFLSIFALMYILNCAEGIDYGFGILASETSFNKENFCIIYFKVFSALPEKKSEADFYVLQDESDVNWCDDQPQIDVKNKVLLMNYYNCSLSTMARKAYNGGAEGLLIISQKGDEKQGPLVLNVSAAEGINMKVAYVTKDSASRLKMFNSVAKVSLFTPNEQSFDYCLVFIITLAVFTVAMGSYWSGLTCLAMFRKEIEDKPEASNQPTTIRQVMNLHKQSSLNIKPLLVAALVIESAVLVLLVYFFFNYMIYFIIAIFVFVSIGAVYLCLAPLVSKTKLNLGKICNVDFTKIVLFLFALGLTIYWLIIRNKDYAWILHCILGSIVCIQVLNYIRMPSFKICTYLAVSLFFYDIFFVFITPYMTGNKSVMEEAAARTTTNNGGGGSSSSFSSEIVPMAFKAPYKLGLDALSVCYGTFLQQPYYMLGFGDVVIPGFLISYYHGFDLITNKKCIYYFSGVISYAIGLIFAFISLLLMNTAQPGLLYLVPCTLLPAAIIGCCRKEFTLLWNGYKMLKEGLSAHKETITLQDKSNNHENDESV